VGIEINMDAKQINDIVCKAIIESALGEKLHALIGAHLESYKFKEDLKQAMGDVILVAMRQCIARDYRDAIETRVRENMTTAVMDEIIQAALMTLTRTDVEKYR